jgi:hypothetical protein
MGIRRKATRRALLGGALCGVGLVQGLRWSSLPAARAQQAPAMPPGGDAQKPAFVVRADKGFIDDPFAIDAAAGELVALRTDSASFVRLDVIDLGSGKTKRQVELGDPSPVFERVFPVPDGKGWVTIMRDPTKGARSAQLHDASGKAAGLVGPVDDFGLVTRGGRPTLVGWQHVRGKAGDTSFVVTAYALEGLTKAGKPVTVSVNKAQELKAPPMKLLGWQAGWSQIVGQLPGGYDKKRDVRLPDRAAVYDLFGKSFVVETEIADVLGWAAVNELRPKHPGRGLIAFLGDGLKTVDIVDVLGRRVSLELPVPMSVYDPTSFREEEDPSGRNVLFSLGVDPLNASALARQRRDRAFLDLYVATAEDSGGAAKASPRFKVVRLVRAALDDRPVSWQVRGAHAAVLRKHKSFTRGGTELEVYAIAAP